MKGVGGLGIFLVYFLDLFNMFGSYWGLGVGSFEDEGLFGGSGVWRVMFFFLGGEGRKWGDGNCGFLNN